VRVPPRSRSRSHLSHPFRRHRSPVSPEPVIISNRVYNDYEDTPTLSHHRSRPLASRPSPAPVIINNTRTYDDYEDENYLSLSRPRRRSRSPEIDFDVVTQAYSFSLSRHTKSSTGPRSIAGSISDISEKSEPQEEEPLKRPSSSGRTQNILRSQYVGDGLIGGRHAVQLTVTPESAPSKRRAVSSIFRWV
jgi:hypothetical protein